MVGAPSDVESNIWDCKKSIEEFDNELLNLHTEVFNRIQEQFFNLDYVGKNAGKSLNDIKNNNRYRLIDIMTGKIWKDELTYDEVQKLYKDKSVASHTRKEKYASGTRNLKGGLIIKDEEVHEMTLSNQGSGKFALVNEGSQIFTKEETDNMDEWVCLNEKYK